MRIDKPKQRMLAEAAIHLIRQHAFDVPAKFKQGFPLLQVVVRRHERIMRGKRHVSFRAAFADEFFQFHFIVVRRPAQHRADEFRRFIELPVAVQIEIIRIENILPVKQPKIPNVNLREFAVFIADQIPAIVIFVERICDVIIFAEPNVAEKRVIAGKQVKIAVNA